MLHFVETGTDIASLAVGDPSLLAELRQCKGREFEKLRDAAVASGALWRTDTGADGAYLFHVFVEEDPPAEIAEYLRDPIRVVPLRVPSGQLLVAGEECFVGALAEADLPHMGRQIEIEAGDYEMSAYRVEPPDDLVDSRFSQRASPDMRRVWSRAERATSVLFLVSLAALIASHFTYLRTTSLVLAALPPLVAVLGWVALARYRRSRTFRAAEKLYRTIANEVPSVALVMRRLSGRPA